MTNTGWIIGAIVVVGLALAAGLVFVGGSDPQVVIAEPSKGTGSDPQMVAMADPEDVTSEPVQAFNEPASEPVVVEAAGMSEDIGSATRVSNLDELIAGARAYANKEVVVRGTIVTQCIRGCKFSLEDGTGIVGVELIDDAQDRVLTAGSVGRQIEVRGRIETSPRVVIVVEEPAHWQYLD